MPVFDKRFFESDIIYVNDLLFELSTIDLFNNISKKIKKTNFLVWAGLRHSIPSHLKNNSSAPPPICSTASPTLTINGKVFRKTIERLFVPFDLKRNTFAIFKFFTDFAVFGETENWQN